MENKWNLSNHPNVIDNVTVTTKFVNIYLLISTLI